MIFFILTVNWGVAQVLLIILAFLALRMKVDVLWVVFVGAAFSSFFQTAGGMKMSEKIILLKRVAGFYRGESVLGNTF